MSAMQHKDDEIADQALLLFYELASDNLPEAQVHRFNAEFPENGFTESDAPDDSWHELVGAQVDAHDFLQVCIGIERSGSTPHVLAKLLVAKAADSKECHIQWMPE